MGQNFVFFSETKPNNYKMTTTVITTQPGAGAAMEGEVSVA